MKLCSRCKVAPSPRNSDPRANSFCKPCLKAYQHEHYLAHKSSYVARTKARRAKHPEVSARQSVEATRRWRVKVGPEFLKLKAVQDRYGLSAEEYKALLVKQNGCCAICNMSRKLHVDHDHQTDAVRGLLCFRCNAAIGNFDDSPERLEAAATYIRQAPRLHLVVG